LRGIANLRGQLLDRRRPEVVLGRRQLAPERQARVLIVASRDVPTGLIIDEVLGFRRFAANDYRTQAAARRDPIASTI